MAELQGPEHVQLLPDEAVEAPEQEAMREGAFLSEANTCSCTVSEAFEAVASWTLAVLMALIIIPLGLPAAIIVITLASMGQVYRACGGSQKDWSLFVVGADKPADVSEECNREVAGKSEAIRGKGAWSNLVYHVQNNHPVFGLFCCARGHPFSPVERFGLLILLASFSYFMAGIKMCYSSDRELGWLLKRYSVACIALPSLLLESLLKYFALLNYKYMLNKYDYFRKTRLERCNAFAKQFCIDHSLGKPEPPREPRAGGRRGSLHSLLDCDCCKACCEFLKFCETCHNQCEDGKTQAVNSIFASLFAGIALTGSCLFIFFGIRMDVESSEDIWRAFGIGSIANFFGIWFVIAIGKFLVKWQYQHWHGRCFVLCQMTIPPEPEPWTELRYFFSTADVDQDGFFSKADAKHMVRRHLGEDLSDEGWQKLLDELDVDNDGKISLLEFEVLRTDFANKMNWWLPERPERPYESLQRSSLS